MPPRFAYWTILVGGLPTAFRAAERDELLPTFKRLLEKHPDAVMQWFARGQLWASPEAAREALLRARMEDAPRDRGRDWRPGGQHRDPRQKYIDGKKARNLDRRKQRFERRQHGSTGRPPVDGEAGPKDRVPSESRPAAPRTHPSGPAGWKPGGPAERKPGGPAGRKPAGPGGRTPAAAAERKPAGPAGWRPGPSGKPAGPPRAARAEWKPRPPGKTPGTGWKPAATAERKPAGPAGWKPGPSGKPAGPPRAARAEWKPRPPGKAPGAGWRPDGPRPERPRGPRPPRGPRGPKR